MTTIIFASERRIDAERWLEHDNLAFLSGKQKEFVLDNLGDIDTHFRVEDPKMHNPPNVITRNVELSNELMSIKEAV